MRAPIAGCGLSSDGVHGMTSGTRNSASLTSKAMPSSVDNRIQQGKLPHPGLALANAARTNQRSQQSARDLRALIRPRQSRRATVTFIAQSALVNNRQAVSMESRGIQANSLFAQVW
jgi:hypothetical protein